MGSTLYRTAADRRLTRPPALPGPDELDRTARQVRLDGGTVHKLKVAESVIPTGRRYWTTCGMLLYRRDGATLTTREVECSRCQGTAVTRA